MELCQDFHCFLFKFLLFKRLLYPGPSVGWLSEGILIHKVWGGGGFLSVCKMGGGIGQATGVRARGLAVTKAKQNRESN